MANKKFWLGMLVLAFGMTVVGCDDGSTSGNGNENGGGSNTDPKTLVITMPATIFNYGASGFMIGIFPVGTTSAQAQALTGIVAGVEYSSPGWSFSGTDPVTLTLPLYNLSNNSRWTGNGIYDVYAIVSGGGGHYYKASTVKISSATTNIQMSSANEIFQ